LNVGYLRHHRTILCFRFDHIGVLSDWCRNCAACVDHRCGSCVLTNYLSYLLNVSRTLIFTPCIIYHDIYAWTLKSIKNFKDKEESWNTYKECATRKKRRVVSFCKKLLGVEDIMTKWCFFFYLSPFFLFFLFFGFLAFG
jgi:hypothetical protein